MCAKFTFLQSLAIKMPSLQRKKQRKNNQKLAFLRDDAGYLVTGGCESLECTAVTYSTLTVQVYEMRDGLRATVLPTDCDGANNEGCAECMVGYIATARRCRG